MGGIPSQVARAAGPGRCQRGGVVPELTRRDVLKAGAAIGGLSVLGFDTAVAQAKTVKRDLRIEGATVSHSVCPYCAVGCSLLTYTRKARNGAVELLQIEGDPDSPV